MNYKKFICFCCTYLVYAIAIYMLNDHILHNGTMKSGNSFCTGVIKICQDIKTAIFEVLHK